jgi:hypothetical protein
VTGSNKVKIGYIFDRFCNKEAYRHKNYKKKVKQDFESSTFFAKTFLLYVFWQKYHGSYFFYREIKIFRKKLKQILYNQRKTPFASFFQEVAILQRKV